MAGRIGFTLIGGAALRAKLASDDYKEPIANYLDRAAIYFTNQAKIHLTNSGAVDTGRTRQSMAVLEQDDNSRTVGPGTDYAPYIEFGRRPGKMPPPDALLPWMSRHGIPAEAVFAVARSIGQRGIPERPFMRPAATDTEAYMKDLMPEFAAEIEARYAEGAV